VISWRPPYAFLFPSFPNICRNQTDICVQFREAHEEVALPRHSPHIFILCRLRPFVSLYKLIVTPIVAFLTDTSVLETLVPATAEVDRIFDHPLEALLDQSLAADLDLVPKDSRDWPYQDDLHVCHALTDVLQLFSLRTCS
jgi:hypothetical protein